MLASYTLFYLWVCYSGFLIPFETLVGAVCILITIVLHAYRLTTTLGVVGTQEGFILGGFALRTKPLPFYTSLFTGKVTLSNTLHRKWFRFHTPTVKKLHLFSVGLSEIFVEALLNSKLTVFPTLLGGT